MGDRAERLSFQELLHGILTNSLDEVRVNSYYTRDEQRLLLEALQGNRSVTLFHSTRFDGCEEELALVLGSTSIQTLSLPCSLIEDQGAKALAASLRGSSVSALSLVGNNIGHEGAKALAEALPHSKLATLNLAGNAIGNEGVKAIASSLKESSLVDLDLSGFGNATTEGIIALAAVLKHSSIVRLTLGAWQIGEAGCKALLEGVRDTAVRSLRYFDGSGCSDQLLRQIEDVLATNRERSLVLRMQAESDETQWTFTFRTLGGTVAAVLHWSLDRSAQGLREAVFHALKASTADYQLPDVHLRA